jgi:haloalkane dehalogenase
MVDQFSAAERRFGLTAGQFPFRSHFIEINGSRLHYVDEGTGPVLFMLHGNPTWSFVFRHLISGLQDQFRCIAVDLAGFGLSDAAADFGHRPDEHAKLIAGLLQQLGLLDVTLVAHDWAGPIGLAAMLQSPGQITSLCLGNTFAWPVNGDFHFEFFSRMMGGPVGRFACKHFNFFVNVVMPVAMQRRKLSDEEMLAYRAPFV